MGGDDPSAMRRTITSLGVEHLAVTDLTPADIELIGWSGSRLHVRHVAEQLERVASGEVEYLAVRAPDGTPIAKGGIDYTQESGCGTIWQVATRDDLQSMGIGTRLVDVAESRIRARGISTAKLSVELDNPRARALYERLGYTALGDRPVSWEAQREDGTSYTYETVVTDMQKRLEPAVLPSCCSGFPVLAADRIAVRARHRPGVS